jgi:hypothetical protein
MEGVDYAWDRPDLNVLWNGGKRFVCRYLAFLPNGKVLQKAELDKLHGKGFGVVLNWEQAAGDMLAGFTRGQTHAREAVLGAPAWVPIYFSCDQDITTTSQMNAVASYLDGAASILGKDRVGVYGEAQVIDALVPTHAKWGWQTYAWSGGRNSASAHMKQYRNGVKLAGADLDLNISLKDNFGAWFPSTGHPDVVEAKVELNDVIELPADVYPNGGKSASVGTILGWTNGRVIYLESAVKDLTDKVAGLNAKLDSVLDALKQLSAAPATPTAAEFSTRSVGKLIIDVEKLTQE